MPKFFILNALEMSLHKQGGKKLFSNLALSIYFKEQQACFQTNYCHVDITTE